MIVYWIICKKQTNLNKLGLLIVVLVLLMFVLFSCSNNKDQTITDCEELKYYSDSLPTDFNFTVEIFNSFSYQFNTHDNSLKKLIDSWANPVEYADTTIILSQKELNSIWRKISEIDILKYPKHYEPSSGYTMTPSPSYLIVLRFNGITKEVNWSKNTETFECQDALLLKELFQLIDSTIINKEEFQNLPEHKFVIE